MKRIYLILAVLGAIIPYSFFVPWIADHGVDLQGFMLALFANDAAGGAFADLFFSSVVFWVWMFTRREGPKPWLFIVLNLTIGLSCALPAYLYASEPGKP